MPTKSIALLAVVIPALLGAQDTKSPATIGEVVRLDPALDALIAPDAEVELLASGFTWSEGPVWIADEKSKTGGYLLFCDIPANRVVKWEEGAGISTFLQPSGYSGSGDYGNEPGSNGLALDAEGRLLSCEHGDRRISVLTKDGGKRTLADNVDGKRFNSPNDLVVHSNGTIYFTDPIYGLPDKENDSRRELDFCGVYKLAPNGEVSLLTKEFERPNGIALSPDEKTLYVAQSHAPAAIVKSFPINEKGDIGEGSVLIDLTEFMGNELPGAPDGLKVDHAGNLFITGPGGCWIVTAEGKALGRISTGEAMANCGWGNDGSVLYMTSKMHLCRIQTLTKGMRTTPAR